MLKMIKHKAHNVSKLKLMNLSQLSDREFKIFEMRFHETKTLEEVSKHFGVTREKIRQIEIRSLLKLR